jgi:hypothetical protein
VALQRTEAAPATPSSPSGQFKGVTVADHHPLVAPGKQISVALNNVGPDEVPDLTPRPLDAAAG